MSVEKVKAYFAGFGMEDRVLEFPVSSATVAEAAAALHCEPCHIAKTLAFLVCETPMVIVMAGDARIDNAKYKARFAKKAKMPTPDEVLTLIGHPVGGVCPFAVPENVNVYLDVFFCLLRHELERRTSGNFLRMPRIIQTHIVHALRHGDQLGATSRSLFNKGDYGI